MPFNSHMCHGVVQWPWLPKIRWPSPFSSTLSSGDCTLFHISVAFCHRSRSESWNLSRNVVFMSFQFLLLASGSVPHQSLALSRSRTAQGFLKENLQLHKSPSLVPSLPPVPSLPFPSLPFLPLPSPSPPLPLLAGVVVLNHTLILKSYVSM